MKATTVAVSNDELGDKLGDSIQCPHCGELHDIEYGTSRRLLDNGGWSEPKEDKTLGFYKCGETPYLAGINGRKLAQWEGDA